jgi:hypothetical protein
MLERMDYMNIIFSLEIVIDQSKKRIAECEDEEDKIDIIAECEELKKTLNKAKVILGSLASVKGGNK